MRRLKAFASANIGALIIFGGIFSGSAIAAETEAGGEIEEVIVTATKRTENLRDVPMTISVLGQSDIEVQGINDAQDIARRVPGLTHSQAGKNLVPHYFYLMQNALNKFYSPLNKSQDGIFCQS